MTSKRYMTRRALPKRSALVVALAMGMGLSGLAYAQATTGSIFGHAPAGDTLVITGGSGVSREVTVGAGGSYSVTLPVGTYTVSLQKGGQVVQTRTNVAPPAGQGVEVDFVAAQNLSAVNVSANALPVIDVSSTAPQTTITATQLRQLPLQRSAAAIAMLAPGVNEGQAWLGTSATGEPMLSFSGATIAENAYYLNGMNTTDPITGQGGVSLPYGSIEQQQVLTGSFGAKYGRSTGGVINQIGKSGTNEWHFGGQVVWRPRALLGRSADRRWANPRVTTGPQADGQLQSYNGDDKHWTTIYDAYVSGPIVKDKLFFFVSSEFYKTRGNSVGGVGADSYDAYRTEAPKTYAKINWNITENNILQGTYLQNTFDTSGDTYHWNDDTRTNGSFKSADQHSRNKFKIWNLHYTSYITDNLVLNAMFGKMDGFYHVSQPGYAGFDPTAVNILGGSQQRCASNGTCSVSGILGSNPNTNLDNPAHRSEVTSKRLSLAWHIGINDLEIGMDNLNESDLNDGSTMTGPGYAWQYGKATAGKPIQGNPGVTGWVSNPISSANPSYPDQYYVDKYIFLQGGSFNVKQKAVYAQDKLQLTSNVLLSVGVRKDEFTNYNALNEPYLRMTAGQIAPRLGVSWDVFGDSSLQVFANAGRYYLALPSGVALREAAASTYTKQFYTYTSINSEGVPQGLKQIPSLGQLDGGNVMVVNGEDGSSRNPKSIASQGLKPEYSDNFVAGAKWEFTQGWVAGLTLTYQKLGRVVDDMDAGDFMTNPSIVAAMKAQGFNMNDVASVTAGPLINPGETNKIPVNMKDGSVKYVTMSRTDLYQVVDGQKYFYPKAKRNFYSAELSLTHPFDGKWMGKIDYVFSRSYGNTEGPIQSNIAQGGTSASITESWDFPAIMQYANGEQSNSRRHVLKAYGFYQITPEWGVSANLYVASGTPESCLGFFGTGQTDPSIGYGGSYHWCGGVPTPPGSTGHTPWRYDLSLGASYVPDWANKRLGFHMKVYNVFNEQKITQIYPFYGSTSSPNPGYLLSEGTEPPRYVQLSVTYDY